MYSIRETKAMKMTFFKGKNPQTCGHTGVELDLADIKDIGCLVHLGHDKSTTPTFDC